MKKLLTILILALTLTNYTLAQDKPTFGIYPFCQNEKWGLKYKEQIVLIPKYEGISNKTIINKLSLNATTTEPRISSLANSYDGFYCYKLNGYWGIMCLSKILTEPIYDEAIFMKLAKPIHDEISFMQSSQSERKRMAKDYPPECFVRIKQQNKYGVITLDGQELLPTVYDDILTVFTLDNKQTAKNIYFLTKRQNDLYITSIDGIDLSMKFSPNDFKSQDSIENIRKAILSEASNHNKNADLLKHNIKTFQTYSFFSSSEPIIVNEKDKASLRINGRSLTVPNCDSLYCFSAWGKYDYIYVYRVNGKYGLFDINRIITEPIYDKIEPNFLFCKITKNGKRGVIFYSGEETVPPIYDRLEDVGFVKGDNMFWWYIAIKNDTINIISPYNTTIISNIEWDYNKDKYENLKKYRGKIKKERKKWEHSSEWERTETDRWKVFNSWENSTSQFLFLTEEGEEININGYHGRLYDCGYITIPFDYDDYKSILARDPDNVFALKDKIGKSLKWTNYPTITIDNYPYAYESYQNLLAERDAYKLLLQICQQKGYHGSELFNYINSSIRFYNEKINHFEMGINEIEEIIEFNQKVDNIANVGTSIINSITTAISNSGNESDSDFGLSDGASGGSGNYQAMYDKWERRAEKHYKSITKSGSSKESKSEASGSSGGKMSGGNFVAQKKSFREAQKEMKKIREKARKAGVIIKQSKWETATIDY